MPTKQLTLGPLEQVGEHSGRRRGRDLDVEARLDVHECVQAVLVALRHHPVSTSLGAHGEVGALGCVREAGEHAADEAGEHEMLCEPRVIGGQLDPAATAPRRSVAIDADVELEHSRRRGHPARI